MFRIVNKKDLYFLYEDLAKKKGAFPIWKRDNLWTKWFEIDFKEVNESHKSENKNELIYEILKDIAFKMNSLRIENNYIQRVILHEIGFRFICDVIKYLTL